MDKDIVKEYTLECSEYVRGNIKVKDYYDATTGEFFDWKRVGDMVVIRDDTEVDTYDLPIKIEINNEGNK